MSLGGQKVLAKRIIENKGFFSANGFDGSESCAPATCLRLAESYMEMYNKLCELGHIDDPDVPKVSTPPEVRPFDDESYQFLWGRVEWTEDGKGVRNKIELIKELREKYHCGLGEAKEYIEKTLE